MPSYERIFTFTKHEEETYQLQTRITCHELRDASDELDCYSCHSQPHIWEVMRECTLLYRALMPWIQKELPNVDTQWMYEHLLLGAKFHDIGMAGTEKQRALLDAVDELRLWLEGNVASSKAHMCKCEGLCRLAEEAGFTSYALRSFLYWYSRTDALRRQKELCYALDECHDDIKRAIRENHARVSGEYIFEHLDELRMNYGEHIDFSAVALIAAMHSNMERYCGRVALAGEDIERLNDFSREFLSAWLDISAIERFFRGDRMKRIVVLATLLRLADTRRNGKLLQSLDGKRIHCRVTASGDVLLYKDNRGSQEQIAVAKAYEILVAEACSTFGDVRMFSMTDGRWRVEHEISLEHANHAEIQRLFLGSRMQSYFREINTGSLAPDFGFLHVIRLHLQGCAPDECVKIIEDWNGKENRFGGNLHFQYADQ